MSRQVNVTGLSVAEHSRYREVCKELGGEAKAARAIFVRGLGPLAAPAPKAPPAPAPKKRAKKRKAPPSLEAPPTVLLDGDA